MTSFFDGKAKAQQKESDLIKRVTLLKSKGITPKLAALQVGENEASEIYLKLKSKMAIRIGAVLEIFRANRTITDQRLVQLIKLLNNDPLMHGMMMQMPLPESKMLRKDVYLKHIDPKKDVDGHRSDSYFLPATVKAILFILNEAQVTKTDKILVVGSAGEVGRRLLTKLLLDKFSVEGIDKTKNLKELTKNADVIISATGKGNLITSDMVKEGVIAIDVGAPLGEFEKGVNKKASFITPVPGGVGPMTVVSLMENLVESAEKNGAAKSE